MATDKQIATVTDHYFDSTSATEGVRQMDWFDLNDWIVLNRPDVYAATRYLSMECQFECWLKIRAKAEAEGA